MEAALRLLAWFGVVAAASVGTAFVAAELLSSL
jgi:hypothetical protein